MSTQLLPRPSGLYQSRPYQTDCIAALAEARKNGVKKGLVVMASGLGKTVTAILDLQQFLQEYPSARILCLCHQESILLQSKAKFQKFFGEEYSYGMFTGNYKTTHPVNFLFATFQTMRDHREEFSPDAFDYIVVDEAHHTAAETYQPTADYFEPQFLLGLTATKDRMDGQDILDTYEQVLYQMDIYDGWAEGWLARVDYRIMLDDLNQEEFEKYVGPHATDEKVSLAQLNKTIFAPQHDEGIVASIREQTVDLDNPSIFIFCSSIEHANAMAHGFGGEAAVIHSSQSIGLNEAILSSFRSGDIRIIISVNMLNEGIDVPEADVVVFLRATESSTIFFQQLGRGLRISGEKRTVRALDYVANIERIAMILEMEDTAKRRIPASPTHSPSVNKPDLLVVNIPATKFKVQRVDVERLLEKIRPAHYSDEQLISFLQEAAKNLGGIIKSSELSLCEGMPDLTTYIKRFGSWNKALLAAGLPINQRRENWDKQSVIEALRRKSMELGRTPSAKDVGDDLTMPSSSCCAKLFGTWSAAIRAANLSAIRPYAYSRTDLIAYLRQKISELGRAPSQKDMIEDSRMPSIGAYLRIFGSWENALAEVGAQPRRVKGYTKSQAIQLLQQKAKQLGRNPTTAEVCGQPGFPHYDTFKRHFGSWEGALAAAGLDLVGIDLGDDKLIELLQQKAKQLGRTPRRREVDDDRTMPSSSLYRKHFGSWRTAVEKAGLQTTRAKRTDYSNLTQEAAVKLLQDKASKIGRTPSKADFDKDPSLPNATVIARRFGSWNEALMTANLQPNQIKENN